jgi:hypothetical protein
MPGTEESDEKQLQPPLPGESIEAQGMGGYLYSFLPAMPTFFKRVEVTAETKEVEQKVAQEKKTEYEERLESYLELRQSLIEIERAYDIERTSMMPQNLDRKPAMEFISTLTMTLPRTTFNQDKTKACNELGQAHAVLIGLCLFEAERIRKPYHNSMLPGFLKSVMKVEPENSALFRVLYQKTLYNGTERSDEHKSELLKALRRYIEVQKKDKTIKWGEGYETLITSLSRIISKLDQHVASANTHRYR